MAKLVQVCCTISGGQDEVAIQHAVEIQCQDKNYLSSLSQQLASLRDTVNVSLSELVDKEKALAGNGHRKKDLSQSDADSGGLPNIVPLISEYIPQTGVQICKGVQYCNVVHIIIPVYQNFHHCR